MPPLFRQKQAPRLGGRRSLLTAGSPVSSATTSTSGTPVSLAPASTSESPISSATTSFQDLRSPSRNWNTSIPNFTKKLEDVEENRDPKKLVVAEETGDPEVLVVAEETGVLEVLVVAEETGEPAVSKDLYGVTKPEEIASGLKEPETKMREWVKNCLAYVGMMVQMFFFLMLAATGIATTIKAMKNPGLSLLIVELASVGTMVAFDIVAAQALLNSYQKVKRFYAPILLLRVRKRALLDKVETLLGRIHGRNTYIDYADVGDGDIRAALYLEEELGAQLWCVKDFADDSANINRPCMYWIIFYSFCCLVVALGNIWVTLVILGDVLHPHRLLPLPWFRLLPLPLFERVSSWLVYFSVLGPVVDVVVNVVTMWQKGVTAFIYILSRPLDHFIPQLLHPYLYNTVNTPRISLQAPVMKLTNPLRNWNASKPNFTEKLEDIKENGDPEKLMVAEETGDPEVLVVAEEIGVPEVLVVAEETGDPAASKDLYRLIKLEEIANGLREQETKMRKGVENCLAYVGTMVEVFFFLMLAATSKKGLLLITYSCRAKLRHHQHTPHSPESPSKNRPRFTNKLSSIPIFKKVMDGKKVIAICQSGGEFVMDNDGSLSYRGGDAHAMEIDDQMKYEDFKEEVGEMFNSDHGVMTIKYFLPGNKKTLITISNDKDLDRMMKFHGNSNTTDIYVLTEEVVAPDASDTPASRSSRTTLSETGVLFDSPLNIMDDVMDDTTQPGELIDGSFVILDDDATHFDDHIDIATEFPALPSVGSTDEKLIIAAQQWQNNITGVGQRFNSVHEFREALRKYAIAHQFAFRYKKNDSHRVTVKCKAEVSPAQSLTFVADREKGLKQSIADIFSDLDVHHGYCIRYLSEQLIRDLKGQFSQEVKLLMVEDFYAAAYAPRLEGFQRCADSIKSISLEAYNWIMESEPEHWANACFQGARYNHMTSNFGELFYSWASDAHELPITQMVDAIRGKISELISTRRAESDQWVTRLTPSMEEKLDQENLTVHSHQVLISAGNRFEVRGETIEVVDIDLWDCSCKVWQLTVDARVPGTTNQLAKSFCQSAEHCSPLGRFSLIDLERG
ncbi:hypothetical protein Vadar_029299 [Vaccinium darrowii]|uniref:Uncharacterized protein n=1 Tax=Vaccinium darrowii TaxID=229202 RepID=A0ACB7X4V0_9ERIC|nr:hypothetical protein Vadar_029299 [Vaccinium darrowii]